MAAVLNQTETAALLEAKEILERVLRTGYDPNSEEPKNTRMARELRKARDQVNTVVTMKGNYPS